MIRNRFASVVLAGSLLLGATLAATAQTTATQDMKAAGSETKSAAQDTGHAVSKGTRHAAHKTKRAARKAAHKTAGATRRGAEKVEQSTTPQPEPAPQP
ncbi:MAG TPA: hypothetical protein VM554_01880 [Acidisarcina sp.]|nr:hypothetical protein [Acidisarcina sp.]